MSTSKNIAIIGDAGSVLCFKAVGVTAVSASTEDEVNAALLKLYKENYAVVFITEQLESLISDNMRDLISNSLISLVLIPGSKGSLGIGMSRLKEIVNKAVGVNID
ncbi:V-type ATP synthase subunit F [Thermodesulfobacteriota bacterium]